MKITSFYYLTYPDCSPTDPMVAASEVYVEVGGQDGSIENFDRTYALKVCTIGFLKNFLATHPFYTERSLIVVDRFEDQIVKEALEAILPRIEEFAIAK